MLSTARAPRPEIPAESAHDEAGCESESGGTMRIDSNPLREATVPQRRAPSARAAYDPRGFHALSEHAVADAVGETSPGNFTLGYLEGSTFTAFYVGRADSDLNATLHAWVDAPSERPERQRRSPHAPWRTPIGPTSRRGALAGAWQGATSAYTHFAFCYAPSALAAFERECRDYHALGGSDGLDNRRHPEPPDGSPWACPMHG